MTKTICAACSAELESQAKFCPDCGAPIPEAVVPQPQPPYQPPPQAVAPPPAFAKPAEINPQLSVFGYLITMLALSIPIVGIILTLVWAFGAKTNPVRKNYCRAVLILSGLFLLLAIIGFVVNYSALMGLITVLLE